MDRKEGELRHPVTSIVSRIEDSHKRIRSDLAVLEKSDDLGQIRAVVDDLPDLLKEHFLDEEKPRGLFEELQSLRPVLKPQLEILRQEHREIMHTLRGLQGQLREVDGVTEADELRERHDHIRVRAAVFLRLIHKHERIESHLVADTYYMEDGGSG
jgi:hypothetical protein